MKQILIFGCAMVLALVVMDTTQVVGTSSGLVVKGGQAFAADLPPPAPLRRRLRLSVRVKPEIGKGKGKAPPPVVTKY